MKEMKGFTLLEVILAATMFAVILLATTHLDFAAVRLTNTTSGEVALRNHLLYAVRVLEKDVQGASEIQMIDKPPSQVEYQDPAGTIDARYEFILKYSDPTCLNGSCVTYVIDPPQAVFTRNDQNLLPGGVSPQLKYAGAAPQSPFAVAYGKIVSLHLAAQSALTGLPDAGEADGIKKAFSSADKSILLRTAVVTGW